MLRAKFDRPAGLASAPQSLYGAAAIGDFAVNRSASRPGWAILVVVAAALALSGCGRKGGLDLPSGSASLPAPTAQVEEDGVAKPGVFDPSYGVNAPPAAAKGRKKSFPLDPLLD